MNSTANANNTRPMIFEKASMVFSPAALRVMGAKYKIAYANSKAANAAKPVAKTVDTYKANVYEALDRLMELGLCTSIFEGRKRVFRPIHPEKLGDVLDEH